MCVLAIVSADIPAKLFDEKALGVEKIVGCWCPFVIHGWVINKIRHWWNSISVGVSFQASPISAPHRTTGPFNFGALNPSISKQYSERFTNESRLSRSSTFAILWQQGCTYGK